MIKTFDILCIVRMYGLSLLLSFAAWASYAQAQFPPPVSGVTTIKSKFNNGITISYKEVSFWDDGTSLTPF